MIYNFIEFDLKKNKMQGVFRNLFKNQYLINERKMEMYCVLTKKQLKFYYD